MLAGNCFELALEPRSRFRAGSARDGRGIRMECLPVQRLREGTFLGPSGRGVLGAGFPASRGERLPLLRRAVPRAPRPRASHPSSGAWEESKDSRP